MDELLTNESRYAFFYRTKTDISLSVSQSIFYASNLQQPIARQAEVIFRSLLFTIVVLEVFGFIISTIQTIVCSYASWHSGLSKAVLREKESSQTG